MTRLRILFVWVRFPSGALMDTIEDVIDFLEACKKTHIDAARWQEEGWEVDEGDTEFHEDCVEDYQEAIDTLKKY